MTTLDDLRFTEGHVHVVDWQEVVGKNCDGFSYAEHIDKDDLLSYLDDDEFDPEEAKEIPDDLFVLDGQVYCEECDDLEIDMAGMRDFGPMMNFVYPLHDFCGDFGDVVKLKGLPLCLVRFPEKNQDRGLPEWGLALTGGGMDMSDSIALGYVRLGFIPPFNVVSRFPMFAGRTLDEEDILTISAMKKEAERQIQAAQWVIEDLKRTEEWYTEERLKTL